MFTTLLTWVLCFFSIYLLIGIIYAVYFVWRGADQLDKSAIGAKRITRVLWFPGAALLWPLLINKKMNKS
jgi:hypothetical protein